MNNPNTIENQVHSILRENMKAQNDDMKLYLLVCNRCYQRYEKQDVGTLPFASETKASLFICIAVLKPPKMHL